MTRIKDAKITGIWGARGSGKSCRRKELTKVDTRCILIDPTGEGDPSFRFYKTFAGLYQALKQNWNKGFRLCLDVSHSSDPEADLLKLSRDLIIIQKPYHDGKDNRKITLLVEEMSLLCPNVTKGKNQKDFLRLCNLGRHYGVNIIGVSQRPAQVHTDFRGNCAEHFFFRMGDHNDYAAARSIVGPNNLEKIRSLDVHHYVMASNGTVTTGKNTLSRR